MATEKRLIDANATYELLRSLGSRDYRRDKGTIMDAMKMISHPEYTPTVDAVEVVRCKDCKHCDPGNRHCDHPMGTTFPFPRKPDDFCSYGERKDNGF